MTRATQAARDARRSHRETARAIATDALGLLAQAVNACDNPAVRYRYGDAEQAEFMRLAREFVALIERGEIVPRAVAVAQEDTGFQRLMFKVVTG